MQLDDSIREEAAAWAVRSGDPVFDDWEDFTAWLERDPKHAAAYDLVAASVIEAVEAEHMRLVASNDVAPARWRVSARWLGLAVTAVLLLVVTISLWPVQGGAYTIETAPGEQRTFALDDGSAIQLAGGSRIALDSDDPRFAKLEKGRALFSIVHDESDPFVLDVGADRLVDAGTIFDVQLLDSGLTVGVSEGAVIFNPDGQDIRIDPGQLLQSRSGANVVVRDIALDQVGEWKDGRLTFENATIVEVARDLSSMTGIAFRAAPDSGEAEVSGSLLYEPIRLDPESLGPLLGLTVRAAGESWIIEAR